jgi:diadenosine tetraphosphate (Ap4A) HIT family hydrolase
VLGPWQYYTGYCILIAKKHATELSQLEPIDRSAFLAEMAALAQALELAFSPRKLNYELLGNQVPHLHWHLFPRYESDPEKLQAVWLAIHRAEADPVAKAGLATASDLGTDQIIHRIRSRLQLIT